MNAERLHAVVNVLLNELDSKATVTRLDGLITALTNLVSSPHPTHQEALANEMQAMYKALQGSVADDFSPTWKQILQEIGGEPFFGKQLMGTIQEIFQRNQITLAIALKELNALAPKLKTFHAALTSGASAFQKFSVGDEKLEPGQCEIGMLIPRQEVHNTLPEFGVELEELSFILNTFAEVATGKPDDLEIKTISSSDLMVFLAAKATFCSVVAVALEKIISVYKGILEVRKLRAELSKQGVPEKATVGIENHANTMMKDTIETTSVEIVNQFYTGEEGRKNELITQVKISMSRMAERIDRGYNIEVRAQSLPKGHEDKEGIAPRIELIQRAAKNIQFLKPAGAPILKLEDAKKLRKPETAAGPAPEQPSPYPARAAQPKQSGEQTSHGI